MLPLELAGPRAAPCRMAGPFGRMLGAEKSFSMRLSQKGTRPARYRSGAGAMLGSYFARPKPWNTEAASFLAVQNRIIPGQTRGRRHLTSCCIVPSASLPLAEHANIGSHTHVRTDGTCCTGISVAGKGGARIAFGTAKSQGRKTVMEDRLSVVPNLWCDVDKASTSSGFPGCSFAGVFDGHHGNLAADIASEKLVEAILARGPLKKSKSMSHLASQHLEGPSNAKSQRWWVSKESVDTADELHYRNIKILLERAYHDVDDMILTTARNRPIRKQDMSGTTALCCVRLEEELYLANAGDSRAVLCRDQQAIRLTHDHKTDHATERQRILLEGGWINLDRNGVERVTIPARGPLERAHGLSVTRGLGDLYFKEPYPFLIAQPEVYKEVLTPKDSFIIMGTDGLWSRLDDQAVVDVALGVMQDHLKKGQDAHEVANAIARSVVDAAFAAGATDNISTIIMFIDGATKLAQT